MKKKVFMLLSAALLACTAFMNAKFTVHADIVSEPYGNAFYEKHSTECEVENEIYTVKAPDGVGIFYESPESSKQVFTYGNGNNVYIEMTFTDSNGVVWGSHKEYNTSNDSGWIPMAYLERAFDGKLFKDQYMHELEQGVFNGTDFDALVDAEKNMNIHIFSYPGSEEDKKTYFWYPGDGELPIFNLIYTDAEGRRWGYVGYFYGHWDSWICIDAPELTFDELYPNGAPVMDQRLQSGESGDLVLDIDPVVSINKNKRNLGMMFGIIGAAVVAVAGAAATVLIILMKKKNKNA